MEFCEYPHLFLSVCTLDEMQPKCNIAPKRANKYVCENCAFVCSEKSKYDIHLLTAKHQNATKCNEMQHGQEISENDIFDCIACNYVTTKHCNYMRHLITNKHLKRVKCNTSAETSAETSKQYDCECGKSYSHRSSLWVHMQQCSIHENEQTVLVSSTTSAEKVNRVLPISQTFTDIDVPQDNMQSMMFDFMKSQSERDDKRYEAHAIQSQLQVDAQAAQAAQAAATAEQTRLLIEAISLNGMQCITNNNTTNNQFNLNVFLNEDCKDAYTLKEVAESIECTVSDLDRMDKDGYAATITRKILESIQNMSITERPIHCTDARRNAVCVKEETGWEKNEMALKSLNSTIFLIGNKIHGMMDDWRAKYPEHRHGSESHRKQYHRLVMEVIKVSDRVTESQIVSKVCNGVILDRKRAKGV